MLRIVAAIRPVTVVKTLCLCHYNCACVKISDAAVFRPIYTALHACINLSHDTCLNACINHVHVQQKAYGLVEVVSTYTH